ncbi:MAG: hypothetical protein KJO07_17450 [Deltaproteobacteria bacterium]|nr:hypothetical protein [Deltaproteobacteria bacterium]
MALALAACKSSEVRREQRASGSGPHELRDAATSVADAGRDLQSYPSIGKALAAIIAREKPRVIGLGEAHQLRSTAHILSPLARFTAEAVPVLAKSGTSNLVLETWAEREQCGKVQKQVDTQVRRDTERPKETQSELVRLLAALDDKGIGRHGMAMSCKEYERLLADDGKVDYSKLLTLITGKLDGLTKGVLAKAPADSIVVVYGGALHNDLYPAKGVEGWSYAASVDQAAGGRYLEIDLYIPELIADDKALHEQPWFELTRSEDLDHGVLVIERSPRSYVILARRGVANPSVKKPSR